MFKLQYFIKIIQVKKLELTIKKIQQRLISFETYKGLNT